MKIFASILLLFFSYSFVVACGTTECSTNKYLSDEKYKEVLDKKVDAIFYGEIIYQSEILRRENGFPYRKLKVKVLRIWKGIGLIDLKGVDIEFSYFDNDCAMLGESGKRMFYVYSPIHKPPFYTGQCGEGAFDDEKTKRLLGEGQIIEEPQPIETTEGFWARLWKKIVSFFS